MKKKAIIPSLLLAFFALSNPLTAKADNNFLSQRQSTGMEIQGLSPEFKEFEKNSAQKNNKDSHGDGYIPEPFEIVDSKIENQADRHLPRSFDLRDHNKVSPVRDQGPNGSCWAFAAYASLESTLMPEVHDFSEKHMRNTHSFDWNPTKGGNRSISAAYLARWSGPIDESDDPYSPFDFNSSHLLTRSMDSGNILFLPDKTSVQSNMNILKEHIMDYGAIQTGMHMDDRFLNEDTWAHYNYSPILSNHAVAIVGWDDNYSKYNFKSTPPSDGAWLIKNSWGKGMGIDGYYWISYHDYNVASSNAQYFANSKGRNSNIYQYDWLGMTSSFGYRGQGFMANVFQASNYDQYLNTTGFFTQADDADYEIYVVDNYTDKSSFNNMRKVSSGHIDSAGYHTIDFGSQKIKANNKFAVIVRLASNSTYYPLGIEKPIRGYSSRARAGYGESFVSGNGYDWDDLSSYSYGTNVCVKAFTSRRPTSVIDHDDSNTDDFPNENDFTYKLNFNEKTLFVGETFKLDFDSPKDVSWKSSNPAIVSVDQNGNIKANKAGKVEIKASSNGKSDIAVINVIEDKKARFEVSTDKKSYDLNENALIKIQAYDKFDKYLSAQKVNVKLTLPSGKTMTLDRLTNINGYTDVYAYLSNLGETGKYKVKVSAFVEDYLIEGETSFIVNGDQDNHTYKLNVNNKDLNVGDRFKLEFDSANEIKWSSSDENIVSVDQNGNIVAKKAGRAIITARSLNKYDTAIINVKEAKKANLKLTTDKKKYSIDEDAKINVDLFDAENNPVRYSRVVLKLTTPSGKTLTLSEFTNRDGHAQTQAFLSKLNEIGRYKIEASTYVDNKLVEKSCGFDVYNIDTHTYKLNINEKSLLVGDIIKLDFDSADPIEWKSTNSDIVSVDRNGYVYAKKVGQAEIIATSNGKSDKALIKVSENKKANIEVKANKKDYYLGESALINVKILDNNNNPIRNQKVNLTLQTPSGKLAKISKYTNNNGYATINAKVNEKGEEGLYKVFVDSYVYGKLIEARTEFNVKKYVEIDKGTYKLNTNDKSLFVGQSFKLSFDSGKEISWQSSDSNIVSVDQNGNIYAKKAGKAIITATSNGKSDKATITVKDNKNTDNKKARFEISANKDSYDLNDKAVFNIKAFNDYNMVVRGNRFNVKVQTPSGRVLRNSKVTNFMGEAQISVDLNSINEQGEYKLIVYGNLMNKEVTNSIDFTVGNPDKYIEKIDNHSYTLNVDKKELNVGEMFKLILDSSSKVQWKSSDENIASVDQNGNIKAKNPGEVTIEAESNGKTDQATISIKDDKKARFEIETDENYKANQKANINISAFNKYDMLVRGQRFNVKVTSPKGVIYQTSKVTDYDGYADIDLDKDYLKEDGEYEIEISGKIMDKEVSNLAKINLDKDIELKQDNFEINIGDKVEFLKNKNKEYKFQIEDEDILKIVDQEIVGLKKGKTKVKVSNENQELIFEVNVKEKEKDQDRIVLIPLEDLSDEIKELGEVKVFKLISKDNEAIKNQMVELNLEKPSGQKYELEVETDENGQIILDLNSDLYDEIGSYKLELKAKLNENDKLKYFDIFSLE